MVNASRLVLRRVFLKSYADFLKRLTIQLGSAELASEALQDTFVRLECATIVEPIKRPRAYLFRTAFNIAINRLVADKRRLTLPEADSFLEVADEAPSPDRIIEARSEIVELKRAIAELPDRRRKIFLAVFFDEKSTHQIASRFGVSTRTIQIELKRALLYLSQRLDRKIIGSSGFSSQQVGSLREPSRRGHARVTPKEPGSLLNVRQGARGKVLTPRMHRVPQKRDYSGTLD